MRAHPHINFGGQCEAAFRFYEQVLGAKVELMLTWGDSPMAGAVAENWSGKICHATLRIGVDEIAGSDDFTVGAEGPRGFQMILDVDDAVEAERMFGALADGGVVRMALQKTFWAGWFGVVMDRFGLVWEVNCGLVQ